MVSDDWFESGEIEERAAEISAERRLHPLEFFCRFLNDILAQNTEDEALELWRRQACMNAQYAEDALFCMDKVLSNPPSDIAALLEEHTGYILYQPGPDAIPFTFSETVGWLRDFRDKCHDALEQPADK